MSAWILYCQCMLLCSCVSYCLYLFQCDAPVLVCSCYVVPVRELSGVVSNLLYMFRIFLLCCCCFFSSVRYVISFLPLPTLEISCPTLRSRSPLLCPHVPLPMLWMLLLLELLLGFVRCVCCNMLMDAFLVE